VLGAISLDQTYLQGMRYAVWILDSWNDPLDDDLLRAFLAHPAASKSWDGFEYEARAAARDALKRHKLPVPGNLIIREEIKRKKSN
jgi:hypothetical protein